MDTKWKIFHAGFLFTEIENTDLGVWNSSTKPGFWVRLVFAVAITVKFLIDYVNLIIIKLNCVIWDNPTFGFNFLKLITNNVNEWINCGD